MEWYSIQVHSTKELFVKGAIEKIAKDYSFEDRLGEVLVPTEDIIEFKKEKEVIKEKSLYPGYVFIQADLDIDMQHKIQNISKVLGFVGEKGNPVRLSKKDIETIKDKVLNKKEARYKVNFLEGEEVLIKEGPFENFKGTVEQYDPKTGIMNLTVNILGRETPVELELNQISKIN